MNDPLEWFTNPEHEHVIGLDRQLRDSIRSKFELDPVFVECGVEGTHSFSYHFRIMGVPDHLFGKVSQYVRDELSRTTPYRFEVQCVETYITE